ncbi:MAG: OmpA family protein, partial [Bacteroidota bacterium]|nr:OmpA family protein [Bacteroidota bacterium]
PGEDLSLGFSKYVQYYDVLGKVTLDSLSVPRSNDIKLFPGVYQRHRFGIIFTSVMHIPRDACYDFYLESDDGSVLWLNEKLIIDNDSTHKMTVKRDTLPMKQGDYNLKLWYCNTYASYHGLIFKVKPVADSINCEGQEQNYKTDTRIVLKNVLFDFNSSIISAASTKELDILVAALNQRTISKLSIVGHTDNVGTEIYNQELSLKRAQGVSNYLKTKLKKGLLIKAEGKGSSMPITSDKDEASLQLNRRVEIFIE